MSIGKVLNNYKFCIGDEVIYDDRNKNTIFIIDNMQQKVFKKNEEYYMFNSYNICNKEDEYDCEIVMENELELVPRELKIPSIYKHFKGQYYTVIGISTPSHTVDFDNTIEIARHTEDNELIGICLEEGKYVHLCNQSKDILVIYRPLYLSSRDHLYVRPLEIFMSEVDREKYPDVIQRYRFEEVK